MRCSEADGASRLGSLRPVRRVAELGSLAAWKLSFRCFHEAMIGARIRDRRNYGRARMPRAKKFMAMPAPSAFDDDTAGPAAVFPAWVVPFIPENERNPWVSRQVRHEHHR